VDSIKTVWPGIARARTIAAVAGVVGIAGFAVAVSSNAALWQSYLFGYVVFLSATLGCVGLTVLHHMVRGQWGYPVVRFFEAGAQILPLMLLLFIPLVMNAGSIFPWANASAVAGSEILQHKSHYLSQQWFAIRALIYFAIWIGTVFTLTRWADAEDKTGDANYAIKRMNFGAPMMVLFVITLTIAFTDLIMSLEVEWFSTIFGLLLLVGSVLLALAGATIYLINLQKAPTFDFVDFKQQWRDMGNLMLTFTILWAYMSFSQFLIIWSGNLPEEIGYYDRRTGTLWTYVGTVLVFLHFLLPFFLLLSSRLKRTPRMLAWTAGFIIALRLVDYAWDVIPSLHRTGQQFLWTDLAAVVGIGGLWTAAFLWNLGRRQMVPEYRAVTTEVVEHA
jgi:hypothetical protein